MNAVLSAIVSTLIFSFRSLLALQVEILEIKRVETMLFSEELAEAGLGIFGASALRPDRFPTTRLLDNQENHAVMTAASNRMTILDSLPKSGLI